MFYFYESTLTSIEDITKWIIGNHQLPHFTTLCAFIRLKDQVYNSRYVITLIHSSSTHAQRCPVNVQLLQCALSQSEHLQQDQKRHNDVQNKLQMEGESLKFPKPYPLGKGRDEPQKCIIYSNQVNIQSDRKVSHSRNSQTPKAVVVILLAKITQLTAPSLHLQCPASEGKGPLRRTRSMRVNGRRLSGMAVHSSSSVRQCFYGPAEEEKLFTAASLKYSALVNFSSEKKKKKRGCTPATVQFKIRSPVAIWWIAIVLGVFHFADTAKINCFN